MTPVEDTGAAPSKPSDGCAVLVPLGPQHAERQGGGANAKRTQQALAMQLLTEKQVFAITAIPTGTLRRWRCTGEGPPYVKMGTGPKARVRYDAVDILEYVEAGKRYPIRAGNTEG